MPLAHQTLRVAAAQPLTLSNDVEANVRSHVELVRRCAARVIVFPELSLTGYGMDAELVDPRNPVLHSLTKACRDTGTVALVGAVVSHGKGRAIGTIAVDANGAEVAYRKMFLGGEECDAYVPGGSVTVIEIDGWRIGLGICKDTRIDEQIDETASLGIDLYVAGLVHASDELDGFGDRARRISGRHSIPVIFAGFAGATGGGYSTTCGGSGIWDAHGRCLVQASDQPNEFVSWDLGLGPRTASIAS